MAQQIINVGTLANDGTGDSFRSGGQKINANFTELYTNKAELADLASTVNAKGASLIGVEDAGGYFTSSTVEGALQEIGQSGITWFSTIPNFTMAATDEASLIAGETFQSNDIINAKAVIIQIYPSNVAFGTGSTGDNALLWFSVNGASGEYSYQEMWFTRVSPTLVVPSDARALPPVLAPLYDSAAGQINITGGGGGSWTTLDSVISIEILGAIF